MSQSTHISGISRRNFLRLSGLLSTGLCLGLSIKGDGKEVGIVNLAEEEALDIELNAWVLINPSGKVTLVTHRAEMGQGVYQSLPQIIAEELEVNLNDVDVRFAQGNVAKYGNQITGGSSSVRTNYKKLLKLSATAREMLLAAAAGQWKVPAQECYALEGHIIHKPSGRKLHYGELIADASKLKAPENVKLKDVSEYKLIRKPLRRKDTILKTDGTAVFGLDKMIPGMLYAMVERNPRLRGKVKSYDDTATKKIPGVLKVFKTRTLVFNTYREGVAVVATNTWAALQGKKALVVEWDDSGFEHLDTETIFKRQQELLQSQEGLNAKKQGTPDELLRQAGKKLDVVYETPYQSHSAMEPLNCVAYYQEDKLEIWGPIQAPEWVQQAISKEMNIPSDKIIVNLTFLGGGFGRKAFMDYPHEAALISKEMKTPVQVIWTREDDMTQGPYRPGISYRCEGLVNEGKISVFKLRMAGQNNDHWMMGAGARGRPNRSVSEGFLKPYYESIKNLSIADVPFETPIPTMWWRSVYASTNGFAYESFIDELAIEAGADPLEFRRAHLQEERCQRLIDKMEEVSGWKKRKKGAGMGVAITECFGSTVGHVVKLSRDKSGKVKIDHVWAIVDCGWYVNPDTIRAQVEGSIVMALGAATMHEIRFEEGKVAQKNFYAYTMPRINDIPPIEVFIMDNKADAGGVGEPGLPAFAPALANAVYDLTGQRIRKLPFSLASL
jgi:isoquinoline 1-oxidoreductase beta subunit